MHTYRLLRRSRGIEERHETPLGGGGGRANSIIVQTAPCTDGSWIWGRPICLRPPVCRSDPQRSHQAPMRRLPPFLARFQIQGKAVCASKSVIVSQVLIGSPQAAAAVAAADRGLLCGALLALWIDPGILHFSLARINRTARAGNGRAFFFFAFFFSRWPPDKCSILQYNV